MIAALANNVGTLPPCCSPEAIGDRADRLPHEKKNECSDIAVARAPIDSSLANTCKQPWIM